MVRNQPGWLAEGECFRCGWVLFKKAYPVLIFYPDLWITKYSKNDKNKITPIYNAYHILNPKFKSGSFKQILTEHKAETLYIFKALRWQNISFRLKIFLFHLI